MKLTEAQIANLYRNNANHTLDGKDIDTFFASSDASNARIQSAEHILNNNDATLAFQAIGSFKDWTQHIADSILMKSSSRFSLLGFKLKPLLTASAMALVVISSVSLMNSNNSTLQHQPMQNLMIGNVTVDSISNNSFDLRSDDGISSNSFDDTEVDSLFNSSFG